MKKLFLLLFVIACSMNAKVLIMTYVHSRPDFIELHVKTFKHFLKDDYEYVVFNDAPNAKMKSQIEQTCQIHKVRCFRVPNHKPNRQDPGSRHMDGIKFSFEAVGFDHDHTLVMIDADMFLVRPFSIVNCLKDHDFVGIRQHRKAKDKMILYAAPSLAFMNMNTLPSKKSINFEGGYVEGAAVDVGGHMYYYFKQNPDVRLKLIDAVGVSSLSSDADRLMALGYDQNTTDLILTSRRFEYYFNGIFIHYYAGGSNWPGYSAEFLAEKNKALYEFVDKQIAFYEREC